MVSGDEKSESFGSEDPNNPEEIDDADNTSAIGDEVARCGDWLSTLRNMRSVSN